MAAQLQERLESLMTEFQKLGKDYTRQVQTLNTLKSQLHENEVVKSEFDLLADDNAIYKLVGPVLIKQERPEARENVKRRIDFLQGEIKRTENMIHEVEVKQEKKRAEVCVCVLSIIYCCLFLPLEGNAMFAASMLCLLLACYVCC